jgi:aspartate racemase
MRLIGVLGGMGPAATADFLAKLVALTPARCDQDHLPVLVLNQPHIPDRSSHILGHGPDPLPYLLAGIDLLNQAEVGLVVVTCNTAHHWFAQMARRSRAPMLHIARACVSALPAGENKRVAIFATRGAIAAGVYQRELVDQGLEWLIPDAGAHQGAIDDCIRAVKAGDLARGSACLTAALATALAQGAQAVILGCTELPVAARQIDAQPLRLIDSTLELARQAVKHALYLGWNQPPWARSEPPDPGLRPPAARPAIGPNSLNDLSIEPDKSN